MRLSPETRAKAITNARIANRRARQARIEKYNEAPKTCKTCGQPIEYDSRKYTFCSQSCGATYNNQGVNRKPRGLRSPKPCLHCGITTVNLKYCGQDCFSAYAAASVMARFVANDIAPSRPSTAKRLLIILRGHRCEICTGTEWMGQPIPLVLDHINGKPSDWRKENLRLLCGNCNMQQPTFAGRNVGKGGGRPYRKLRYQQGLSY